MIACARPANFSASTRHSALSALLFGVLIASIGCENKVDNSLNNLPKTALSDTTAGGSDATTTDTSACAGCDCLKSGSWYRFNTLTLKSLDGNPKHSVIAVLNGLWSNDIEHNELNFFLELIEVGPTKVKAKIINGARMDGSDTDICLLDDTQTTLEFPRSGCCLLSSSVVGMNIYVGTPTHAKNCGPSLSVPNVIPVRGSVLEGVVSAKEGDACGQLHGIVPQGALSKASLKTICTCLAPGLNADSCGLLDPAYTDDKDPGCGGCNAKYQNLYSLLTKFKPALEFNCKDDAGAPAACLTATFDADHIDAPPPICK